MSHSSFKEYPMRNPVHEKNPATLWMQILMVLALAIHLLPASVQAAGYYPPSKYLFGPWYGTGAPDWGGCGCGNASTMATIVPPETN